MAQQDIPSTSSLKKDLDDVITSQRAIIDSRNQEEFIETVDGVDLPARLCPRKVIKENHIKSTVVDNQEGPLSRSIVSSTSGKLVSPHGLNIFSDPDRPTFNGLEERVRNIETHLSIVVAPLDKSLAERVKILEDKILKIEQFYPQIAAHVFNYGQAEVEASTRPGGRVSKLPGASTNLPAKRRIKDDPNILTEEEHLDQIENPNIDDSSLGELKRRMIELKCRLLKQAK